MSSDANEGRYNPRSQLWQTKIVRKTMYPFLQGAPPSNTHASNCINDTGRSTFAAPLFHSSKWLGGNFRAWEKGGPPGPCFSVSIPQSFQNGISNRITHLQATCGGQKLSRFQIQDAFHEFIQHLTVALCEAWKSHSSLDLIDFWTLKLGDNQKWLAISYDFVREPLAP